MEKRNFNNDFQNYKEAYIKFKEYIYQGITIEEIANCYDLSIERVNNILIRFEEFIDPVISNAIKRHYSQFKILDNKALIITDTHIGSYYEYLELFDTIFNFCNIYNYKNIIHAGDLIEGNSYTPNKKDSIDIQIEKVINIFNQKGIPNMFYLYGNHEQNAELYDKFYLKEELKKLDNLTYIGKGNSYIELNDNDPINIRHKLSSEETCVPNFETNLKLEGHHHCYNQFDNTVLLPPLSLISGTNNLGFVTVTTTGNEYILDVYKDLENNIINHHEQKIIKKYIHN